MEIILEFILAFTSFVLIGKYLLDKSEKLLSNPCPGPANNAVYAQIPPPHHLQNRRRNTAPPLAVWLENITNQVHGEGSLCLPGELSTLKIQGRWLMGGE